MSIVYSQCWEDSRLNTLSLKPVSRDTVVSITSGGCNSLALLIDGAGRVVSFDFNPEQNYLLRLKVAGIKFFDLDDFRDLLGVEFIGISPRKKRRVKLFKRLSPSLDSELRDYWEKNLDLIEGGVINCGKIERYFKYYGRVLRHLYSPKSFERFFLCRDLHDQQEMYEDSIDKNRWRMLNVLFLNKWALSLAKGAHSFKFVEDVNLESNIYGKVRHLCLNMLLRQSPYLPQIITGRFPAEEGLPEFLMTKNWDRLKGSLNRLEIRTGPLLEVIDSHPDGSIHKFNVSNIFEWMDQELFEQQLDGIHRKAAPGAIMCYRYTFVRKKPLRGNYLAKFCDEPGLARLLHLRDRSFMYNHFIIHDIIK